MSTASRFSLKSKCLKLKSSGEKNPFYHRRQAKIYVDELRQSVGQEKLNGETSFFESMAVVFRVGLCLGILPLSGLWQRRWDVVEFRWMSLQTLLTMGIIVGGYTLCLSEFISVTRYTISARSLGKL
jgi:Trehalose receptor